MSRKKKHPEHVNHERWLVSYADFITLLFAFFTTLYAISTVDQKKAGKLQYSMMTAFNLEFFPSSSGVSGHASRAMLPPAVNDMNELKNELQKLADTGALKGKIEVRATKNGVAVSLPEASFFDSGRAEISTDGRASLDVLCEHVKPWAQKTEISVEGHTDNRPIKGPRFGSNWDLSVSRATFVVNVMLTKHGFDPAHLSAAGYAEFRPLASNKTAEGRARNRRVDMVLRERPELMQTATAVPAPLPVPERPKDQDHE